MKKRYLQGERFVPLADNALMAFLIKG